MNEFKGTPGPWELGTPEPLGEGLHVPIHGVGHGELAMAVWQMADDKFDRVRSLDCEANALLIAAAPELLEALIAVEDAGFEADGSGWGVLHMTYEDWTLVKRAIAKALGEKP